MKLDEVAILVGFAVLATGLWMLAPWVAISTCGLVLMGCGLFTATMRRGEELGQSRQKEGARG